MLICWRGVGQLRMHIQQQQQQHQAHCCRSEWLSACAPEMQQQQLVPGHGSGGCLFLAQPGPPVP